MQGAAELQQKAAGGAAAVTEKALGDFFVREFPSMRPDYMRNGVKWLVEKLGEGAAPLLLGSDFNPAGGEGSWEDDKYSIVSMLALSRFSVSSGLAG